MPAVTVSAFVTVTEPFAAKVTVPFESVASEVEPSLVAAMVSSLAAVKGFVLTV